MSRRVWLLLGIAAVAGLAAAAALVIVTYGVFGAATFSKSDCKTPFVETTSCRGQDSSFQECYYFFRADGVPDRQVCDSFKRGTSPPGSSAGSKPCDGRSPSGWHNEMCGKYGLPESNTCFVCSVPEHEQYRRYMQAFDETCTHAILLAACNAPIERAVALGPP